MPELFEETSIKSLVLKNRFIRSATWMGLAAEDGTCTRTLIDRTAEVAAGGAGLVISGFASVSKQARLLRRQLGVYSGDHLAGLGEMAEAVHRAGSRAALQLCHVGIFTHPEITGCEAIGPSLMPGGDGVTGRAMSREEIDETAAAFGRGARRAREAGFDAVQIHAAHGFLLSQFLSPYFNRRDDAYGGNLESRARFVREVLRSVRVAVGDAFPVLIKINSEDFIKNGITADDMVETARMLEEDGIDAVEISGGSLLGHTKKNPKIFFSPMLRGGVYYEEAAGRLKAKIDTPLMLVGGIRSYDQSRRLLEDGLVDYVALCRPLIREPDLVDRWRSGDRRDGACVSCNACLSAGVGKEGGVRCVRLGGYRKRKGLLRFYSGSSTSIRSGAAVAESLEDALGKETADCDLLIIYTSVGHDFEEMLAEAHRLCPNAQIVGATCAGVIGRDGPSEAKRCLAVMAVRGAKEGFAVAAVPTILETDSYDVGRRIARDLKRKNANINMILAHPSTPHYIPAERLLEGVESIFGPDVPIFGGASIDEMKMFTSHQFLGRKIFEKGIVAVGFADPTQELISGANHGFKILGKPFTVTRSEGSRIYELDGRPAWTVFTECLGLSELTEPFAVGVFAQLAAELLGMKPTTLEARMKRLDISRWQRNPGEGSPP